MKVIRLIMAILLVATVCLSAVLPGIAEAQHNKQQDGAYMLEGLIIKGKVRRPAQAMIIKRRAKLEFRGVEKTENFIPKIVESLEQNPF